jgi:hypothetical protein
LQRQVAVINEAIEAGLTTKITKKHLKEAREPGGHVARNATQATPVEQPATCPGAAHTWRVSLQRAPGNAT